MKDWFKFQQYCLDEQSEEIWLFYELIKEDDIKRLVRAFNLNEWYLFDGLQLIDIASVTNAASVLVSNLTFAKIIYYNHNINIGKIDKR
jgi:hypothetical protein